MRTLRFMLCFCGLLTADTATNASCKARRPRCNPPPALTPGVARQALLEMLASQPGEPLEAFTKDIVARMAKIPIEKRDGLYRWTGACVFDPGKATYTLLIPWGKDSLAEFIRPKFDGLYILVQVFEGSFELRAGRWIATPAKYKYTLLD